ncbi:MAG: ribose 1,5-bisphosphate isomerase [Candidatus Methanoperedens nitroreducens]|uniref:Ribose 1,5-bisphosphate isomerase n=1 Tax=Candidatus Methanoperedens nitratireducens TaxID=1392998 RepID=A0A0P8DY58_9EURY|nr:ribose 1,5-bisphosphate isomerase [Candidatus Methanoperedens sp. BLZ2]KAB2944771.1 MAG: ribose 1,5-bisphosphate isomerase [Candidatus Methanoperedens sp.]KPQ42696.1 MAG: ribose 1,5-bisphosphate isomerase [Candidatus Methanoperedens sp. BLZ1]MBZ0177060.1 ribose 1,5-bisphosphate isomerase [Candidatus Methanoperedens nitroreducens]MCX9077491.1 ribose 1,5-bisphosphate isomerase [Candidatus Methanoperedens sp.]MCX9087032.1 ribose 1,5-bisphosphate isomerase [Candidatus Methanoperedens sp.]
MKQLSETAQKIKNMEIRGAGRIARAAAAGLRDYSQRIGIGKLEEFNNKMIEAARLLISTRPTAVSLPNAVRAVMRYKGDSIDEAKANIKELADGFILNSESAVLKIGEIGAHRIRDGDTIMTHCNSSAAISIMAAAHKGGKNISVIATESRPRWQGHLTIRQLDETGIKTSLIVDSAVRYFMKEVDLVVMGADAVTANGSVINKIGTSQLALAAHEARKNVIIAAETYKFSPKSLLGELIEIEERNSSEVIADEKLREFSNVSVKNPAFDVTPREYIDLICTEVGAIPPEMAYFIIKEYLGWGLGDMDQGLK